MEPMGTITKLYAFVDQDTRETLDELQREATSYFDFVRRLVIHVTKKEASEDLSFIAAVHSWYVKDEGFTDLMKQKYGHVPMIRPWCSIYGVSQFYRRDLQKKVKEDIDLVVKESNKDWIKVLLLILNSLDVYSQMDANQKLAAAQEIMESNPNLRCFQDALCEAEATVRWHEGNPSVCDGLLLKAREEARAINDALTEYKSIQALGNRTKNVDHAKGLRLFEEAYQIALDLDVPFLIADLLSDYSLAYEIAGEYDLALSSQLEGHRVYEKKGMEVPYIITSRIYAHMGNGEASLEWAERALEHNQSWNATYLRKAQALAMLNRLDEAQEVLEVAARLSLQTGHDRAVSRYNLALGQYEMAKGNYEYATECLELAYEISSRMKDGTTHHEVLVTLANAELALLKSSPDRPVPGPGKWMTALENHAREMKLPGIALQAAILNAELLKCQGQLRDAKTVLTNSLSITDSPGVKTLIARIRNRIQEIDQLMREEFA